MREFITTDGARAIMEVEISERDAIWLVVGSECRLF